MEPVSRCREDFCLRPPGWTDSELESDGKLTVTPITKLTMPLKPAPPSRRFVLPKSDEHVELAKVASAPFKTTERHQVVHSTLERLVWAEKLLIK